MLLPFLFLRRQHLVSLTPLPLYPLTNSTGIHCIGGWAPTMQSARLYNVEYSENRRKNELERAWKETSVSLYFPEEVRNVRIASVPSKVRTESLTAR
jgi:hypothetical protein